MPKQIKESMFKTLALDYLQNDVNERASKKVYVLLIPCSITQVWPYG